MNKAEEFIRNNNKKKNNIYVLHNEIMVFNTMK